MGSRIQAIEHYALGEPVKDIEDITGVDCRQVYRLFEQHDVGCIFVFSELIAHVPVTAVRPNAPYTHRGVPTKYWTA